MKISSTTLLIFPNAKNYIRSFMETETWNWSKIKYILIFILSVNEGRTFISNYHESHA